MRIAVIEQGHREYLLDTFARHPDFAAEIVCFAEEKPSAQSYREFPVIPLSELKGCGCDAVLVAVSHNHHLSRLLTRLHDEKVANVHVLRLFALDTHADFIAGGKFDPACVEQMPGQGEKPYLVHLETHVCDHCNLNCKACNNFSPFVTEPEVADIAQFDADLRQLAKLFSNIGRFFLLGGEPLLEPERCGEMAGIVRRYFPDTELRVLTNALLVQKMTPEFWSCLRENDAVVHISVYPPVLERLEEIEATLRAYGVKYLLARKVERFVKRLTLYPFEDAGFNNDRCGSAGCHYLRGGGLAKCPDGILVGNMAPALGCSPEALRDGKVINIAQEDDGWEVIRRLDSPCDLCRRCTHRRLETITWEPVKGAADAADWLIENRLEYENRKLSGQLREAAEQKEKAEAALRDAAGKMNQQEAMLRDAAGKMNQQEAMLRNASDRVSRQEEELRRAYHKANEQGEELRCARQSAKELEAQLQEERLALSAAEQNVSELKKAVADGEHNLEMKLAELQNTQKEAHNWRTKFEGTNGRLRDKERQFNALDKEYHAVLSSMSFRRGRALTWLPRKVRGGIGWLKEIGKIWGGGQSLVEKLKSKIFPESFLKLNQIFKETVLVGFREYSEIIKTYGDDVTILGCAPKGTGDYYICGLYLEAWLERNNVSKYMFLVSGSAEQRVAELFPAMRGHLHKIIDTFNLRKFRSFVGRDNQKYIYLHHANRFLQTPSLNISSGNMMGYRGLNMVDLYLYCGFDLPADTPKTYPEFETNQQAIDSLFTDNSLIKGKTVLLAPYSVGLRKYQLSPAFWQRLAKELEGNGFSVCTNCAENEAPVAGTRPIFLPYGQVVPFLNAAGCFVGLRSGLCDVISAAACKKIIIHIYKAQFWPAGNSIAYTGLCNMGLCDDAVEIEAREDQEDVLLRDVISHALE